MGHNHPPKQSAEAPAQFELSADDINPQLAEVWGTADTAEQRLAEKYQDFSQQDLYQLAMDSYKTSHELKQKGVLSLRETVRQQEAQHVYEEAVSAAHMHLIGQIDTAEVVLKRYDLTDEQIADEVDKDLAKEGLTGLSAKQIMRRVNEKRAKYTEMREAVEREKEENERYLEQLNAVPARALRELMREDDDEYQMTVKSDGTVQWGGRAASVDTDTPQAAAGQGPETPELTSRPEAPTDAEPTPDTSETTGETEAAPASSEKMAIGSAAVDRTINALAAEEGLEAPTATTEAMAANAADIEQPTTAMEAGQGPEAPEPAAQPHAANEKAANAQTGQAQQGRDNIASRMLGIFSAEVPDAASAYDPTFDKPVVGDLGTSHVRQVSDEHWAKSKDPGWRGAAKRFIGRLSPRYVHAQWANYTPFVRESGKTFNAKSMKPERPTDAEAKVLFSSLMNSPMLEAKLLGEEASAQEAEAVHSALNLAYTDWSKLNELAPDIRQAENKKLLPHVKNLESMIPQIEALLDEDRHLMAQFDDNNSRTNYSRRLAYARQHLADALANGDAQAVTRARVAQKDLYLDRRADAHKRDMQYDAIKRELRSQVRDYLRRVEA